MIHVSRFLLSWTISHHHIHNQTCHQGYDNAVSFYTTCQNAAVFLEPSSLPKLVSKSLKRSCLKITTQIEAPTPTTSKLGIH